MIIIAKPKKLKINAKPKNMADYQEWKEFDMMSYGKLLAVIYAIVGFVQGIILTITLFAVTGMLEPIANLIPGLNIGTLTMLGPASIVVLPLAGAIAGFLSGVIMAFIYNISAKYVGGLKIRVR